MQGVEKTLQVVSQRLRLTHIPTTTSCIFLWKFWQKNAMNPGTKTRTKTRDSREYSDPSTWVVHPQIQDGLKLPATARVARAGDGWLNR